MYEMDKYLEWQIKLTGEARMLARKIMRQFEMCGLSIDEARKMAYYVMNPKPKPEWPPRWLNW